VAPQSPRNEKEVISPVYASSRKQQPQTLHLYSGKTPTVSQSVYPPRLLSKQEQQQQQQQQQQTNNHNHTPNIIIMSSGKEIRNRLIGLQNKPENAICCDCQTPKPTFCLFTPIDEQHHRIGAFICTSCAAVHRSFRGQTACTVKNVATDECKLVGILSMSISISIVFGMYYALLLCLCFRFL
jgi:hypothetical protein